MESPSYRDQLYEVFANQSLDLEAQIDQALSLGTEYLELSLGFFTRIEQGTQRIVQSVGDHPLIQPGGTCPLDEAYCRRTIELDSPLAVQHAKTSSAVSEKAFETFDLGTYIGGKVVVDGDVYGTICFADQDERHVSFTEAERYFVELLATLTGHAVARQAYEQELDQREARLDERAEIYRALINASFDLVFRIDTQREFTFLSEAITELLGYSPREYIGKPFTVLLPDAQTTELAADIYAQALAGQTVEHEYFPVESQSGDIVVLDIRLTPIYQSTVPSEDRTPGDIIGVQGTARDATERLRRDRLNRVLNRVLRHTLRNDINVIGGYAQLLAAQLTGQQATYASRIVGTSTRLMNLAESARKLEENLESPPVLEPLDIVPNQVDERYPNADIVVQTPSAAVAQGAQTLETAVWELLDNAAKHSGDQPTVSVAVTATDGRIMIQISDTGPGIPEMERSMLTTGEETPLIHGEGLGLWLVYWIIDHLDGTLDVSDRDDGAGSCITVRLHTPSSE
jgi:PAS domain S-box-containing protein